MTKIHQKQQQKIGEVSKRTANVIHSNTNYIRLENHTNIQFTSKEMQLLT
jgi:hypothetical protein